MPSSFTGENVTARALGDSRGVTDPHIINKIEEILSAVRKVFPANNFIVEQRGDGGFIFKPNNDDDSGNNLCTIWITKVSVFFDVRSQQELDGKWGKRRYPDPEEDPTFLERIHERYKVITAG